MKRTRGFTLLEVLVAFAILIFALAAVYEVFVSSASRIARLRTQPPAVALAESLLAEHTATPEFAASTSTGEWGPYHWKVEVIPRHPPPKEANFTLPVVTVAVTVRSGEPAREFTLQSLAIARRVYSQ
jgi:Tfp pilus assembly protein PilV